MKQALKEFLTLGSKLSSLRLKTTTIVFTGCLSILIVVISVAFRDKPDYSGAAILVTALGAVIYSAVYGKNQSQKLDNEKLKSDG